MSDEAPKFRLRPKLAADSAPAAAPLPTAAESTPADVTAGSSESTGGPGRPVAIPVVKLKPRVGAEPADLDPNLSGAPNPVIAVVVPDPPAPPVPPPAVAPPMPPPLPPRADANDAPHAHPHIRTTVATTPPRSGKKVQLTALAIGLGGVVIFATVGRLAYKKVSLMLKAAEEERAAEQPVSPKKRSPAAPGATTPAPTPQQQTAATKVVPHAPNSGATATKAEPAATPLPAIATAPATPAQVATPVPPGAMSAPTAAVAETPNAGAQAWLNKLKINGARGGSSPRVLIGGKTYLVGDVVSAEFGLVFAAYDPTREVLQFKDAAGLSYERRVR